MEEIWKSVEGYAGRYEVSNMGRVRSFALDKPRILKPGRQSNGYMSVVLYDGSTPKQKKCYTVHRLVAEAFIGPRKNGLTINHKDGVKTNNALENLEYMSMNANIAHGLKLHYGKPTPTPGDPLTDDEVRSIRNLVNSKVPVAEIFRLLNADRATYAPKTWIEKITREAVSL